MRQSSTFRGAGNCFRLWVLPWLLLFLPALCLSQAGAPDVSSLVLRTIKDVYDKSPDEVRKALPVDLDVVVTYVDPEWGLLFISDQTGYSFIDLHTYKKANFLAGARIRLTGVTSIDEGTTKIVQVKIRVEGRVPLPAPEPRSVAELNTGLGGSHYVVTEGELQRCDMNWGRICYRITDGTATAWIVSPKAKDLVSERLIGSKVRVKGVAATHVDADGKMGGAQLCVNSMDDIEVLAPGPHALETVKERNSLRTVRQVQSLSIVEAMNAYPVDLQGVVTYSDPEWGLLFIHDDTGSIYINVHGTGIRYPLGTKVRVEAVTGTGDAGPIVTLAKVEVVGQDNPPAAAPLSIAQLNASNSDSSWISTTGVLHSCEESISRVCFRIFDGKSSAWVIIPQPESAKAKHLIGAEVRIRGVRGIHLDATNKPAGAEIFVNRLEDVEVQNPALDDTFLLPLTLISKLDSTQANQRFVKQVHVHGAITWAAAGRLIVQDSSGSVSVAPVNAASLHLGQVVDAVGFPTLGDLTTVMLTDSQVRLATSQAGGIAPLNVTSTEVIQRSLNGMRVRLRAQLVGQNASPTEFVFFLDDGKQRFNARLPRNDATREIVGMPNGAYLKVTGVVVLHRGTPQWPESIQILVASPADIVLDETGWFTFTHVLGVLGAMSSVVVVILIWVGMLRRTVRKQTAILRATLENELQMATQYQRLFERNLAAVFRWYPDGSFLDFNIAFVKMLGLGSREELVGRSYWDFEAHAGEREKLRESLLREEPQNNRDATLCRDDGIHVHVLMNITPVDTPKGMLYETTAIDITQLRHHQVELQKAKDAAVFDSLNDSLTGLPNRRMVAEKLDHLLKDASRDGFMIALIYIDLDGFKIINDSLGHAIGDGLLVEVGTRLRSQVRQKDIVARLGGDEFMVILEYIEAKEESALVAGGLLESLSNPFWVEGHEVSVGASVGISVFPESAENAEDLIKQADSAMYVAKREGKNRLMYFTPQIGAQVQERVSLENQLRGAMQREEISLHYQPEFELPSHRLIRFEALARWTHPAMGSISPAKFIPIAEESGLIVSLGNFIMEQACIEALRWQGILPHPVQVAVNVSSIQFRRRGFIEEVRATLEKTGLDPKLLQIELTESVMMGEMQQVTEIMNQLHELGIGLAIDDFGTGYSSMSYLRTLLFDTMKIDSSFVRGLGTQPESESMVQTLIILAQSFGMSVIVEGVETAQQLEIVQTLGANEVQGYLTGRPTANPMADFLLPEQAKQEAVL